MGFTILTIEVNDKQAIEIEKYLKIFLEQI